MLTADDDFREVRQSGRVTRRTTAKKPFYAEPDTSESSEAEDDDEQMSDPSEQEEVEDDPPKRRGQRVAQKVPLIGRLGFDAEVASGRTVYEQLCGSGPALKLVIDEWMNLWDNNAELAALQLVNFVLLVSEVEGMTREDVAHPDPASVLAELQENWQVGKKGDYLLSVRNKTKMAKSMKRNFTEFWTKWAAAVLPAEEEAARLIVSWLMTMSSSGYRPLRHTATVACYNILTGCGKTCSTLATELDQANRLTGKLRASNMVDSISSQMAQLEKVIQMIFDGVFVQRFRDVDPIIRIESIGSLQTWIEVYSEVFLDNSYLRYVGWAFSDRIAVVRAKSVEVFAELYRNGSLREGMNSFTLRFLPRVLEMAERDVDLTVRNESYALVSVLYRFCDDEAEFRSESTRFVFDLVRFVQPITKSALDLILCVAFYGESHDALMKKAESAMSDSNERPEMAVAWKLAQFVEECLVGVPAERRAICVEHFVCNAKRMVPVLRDVNLWLHLAKVVVCESDDIFNYTNTHPELHSIIPGQISQVAVFYLLQAVARYGFVYVNSTADLTRQMIEGMNTTNSRDLAQLLAVEIPKWIDDIASDDDVLSALLDLMALADATLLSEKWLDSVEHVEGLVAHCTKLSSAKSLFNLLRLWQNQNVPEVTELLQKVVAEDVLNCHKFAASNDASLEAWNKILEIGFISRLAAIGAHISIPDSERLFRSILALISSADVYLENAATVLDEVKDILVNEILPALFQVLTVLYPEESGRVLCRRELKTDQVVASTAALNSICMLAANGILPQINVGSEDGIVEFVTFINKEDPSENHPRYKELAVAAIFDLGRLFLAGVVSDKAAVVIFRLYHYVVEEHGVAARCYVALWERIVAKYGDDTLSLISKIVLDMYDLHIEEDGEYLSPMTKLAMIFGESLKNHPEIRNAQLLVELHGKTLEAIANTEGSASDEFMNAVMPHLSAYLSPNLATELLATLRKSNLDAPEYAKAVEKAATRKIATPRRRAAKSNTGGSRLRQEVVSEEEGSEDDGTIVDGRLESEAAGLGSIIDRDAPIQEMAGLRMSSEPILPSSPLPARKRVIRP